MHQVDLEKIRKGLLSDPKYVNEHLQWITKQGQDLYSQRKRSVDVFNREIETVVETMTRISPRLSSKVILIDLGAGMSKKTVTIFQRLLLDRPDRKMFYLPVDLNEIILNWEIVLKSKHPKIYEHIVGIKPVQMDMLEVVKHLDYVLPPDDWADYDILFSLLGPMSTILHNTYFINLVSEVQRVLTARGGGAFLFTYVASHPGIERRINTEYYDKLDMSAIMKCVLLGLNQACGCDIDPNQFEYVKRFRDNLQTPGVCGKWSGFTIYARAKTDLTFYCDKLDLRVYLKSGELVRLSDDVIKAHYYQHEYIASLASSVGLKVETVCQDDTQLISAVCFGPLLAKHHHLDMDLYI